LFSHDLGTQLNGLAQRVAINGLSWYTPAGSYADYDYIRVGPQEPLNDDLVPAAGGFWLNPPTIHERDPNAGMGLIVERQSGKTILSDVAVAFYQGDPKSGGTLIGRGKVALLPPRSQQSTAKVSWQPLAGTYTLYAVIDPNNQVSEDDEGNNVISRTVTVLPVQHDQLAPRVDRFSIDDDATTTSTRAVRLSAAASDNPGGSGLARILYMEYMPVPDVGGWAPIHNSGWLEYTEQNTTNYPWELQLGPGLHCLQAWAVDQDGNISLAPYLQCINYVPPIAHVGRGEVQVYRQELRAGQRLDVHLNPQSGDADLYVWAPGTPQNGEPPHASNLGGMAADEVTLTAPRDGTYQIEVYGYTDADYSLEILVGKSTSTTRAAAPAGTDPSKPLRSTPTISLDSRPTDTVGIPSLPNYLYYLPLAIR
jgi:hypothetical protein